MNNRSYFSQYESPNIVIVPTMSCNPPSPKRQKLGNNIVVPIVNNDACEKQKIKVSQESNRIDNPITCKGIDSNKSSSTIPTSLKGSWAANYLQSIGLDKKSLCIWNRKIPRKTTSQTSIVTVKPSKKTAEITPTSTSTTNINIENSNTLNIPNKIVTNSNSLKDANTKVKRTFETKNRFIKDKSKESKQSNDESKKSVSVKNTIVSKNNKTVNILMRKNKNDQNKKKSLNIEKNKSLKEQIKLSGNHNLHILTEKNINATSQKHRTSKFETQSVPKSHRQKCQNIVEEKSKMKSVVVKKKNVVDRRKSNCKLGHNHPTNDSNKLPVKYSCSNYNDKSKNSKCSAGNATSISDVNFTKNDGKQNELTVSISKNAQYNTELKMKGFRKTTEVSNRTKTKEKSSKSKSDLKSASKTIKSPIKRKPSKSKRERKIKIVINLICNQNPNTTVTHETPCNESNGDNNTCTVPNEDLDFLNDFDIDEIVESLDICENNQFDQKFNNFQSKAEAEKENSLNNNQNSYKNNIDAIDLIKTLKGEEDDDFMKISIENGKDFLIGKVVNNVTPGNEKPHSTLLDIEPKVDNGIILNTSSSIIVKTEENEVFDVLSEGFERASGAAGNSSNGNSSKNINSLDTAESYNVNKNEIPKTLQETVFKIQLDTSRDNSSQSAPDDSVRNGTLGNISNDLNHRNNINTLIIEEKNISSFVGDEGLSSVFNKVNTVSIKQFKLDKDMENINEAKCYYKGIPVNNVTNDNGQLLNENVENLYFIDQSKILLDDTPPQKIDADNNNKIVDEKNTIHTCSSNVLQAETNSKDTDFINKDQQKDNSTYNVPQLEHEKLDNKCLVNAGEKETNNNNEKNIKATKEINNSDEKNDSMTNSSMCKSVPQQNIVNFSVALVSNNVKDEAIGSCNESQENRDNSDKVYPNVKENLMENKQKNLQDIKNEILVPQKQLSNCDEHPLGNIKSKDDEQSILEERLLTFTGSKYSIMSLIHKGKFSKIFKCKHPNGKHYALKMPTTNIQFNSGKRKTYMLDSLISDIPKENLFIICLVKGFNVGKNWCFLMEYYPKNLDQVMSLVGKPLSINQIQDYARQLVMAVMVLRNKNMVHLDIKPKHILINSSNNMLKLCGFDNLCYIDHMSVLPNIGAVNYRAPEVILGYKSDFQIDVWATGLVLYEMATYKRLFPGFYNNDILYQQMCTLGVVPYEMVRKSRFGYVHFIGWKFMKKSGYKGQDITLISKFNRSNKLCDSIYAAYFANNGGKQSASQRTGDIEKLNLFVKLLHKMLVIRPESRLPIEFVYSNPFIYDAYSYPKW